MHSSPPRKRQRTEEPLKDGKSQNTAISLDDSFNDNEPPRKSYVLPSTDSRSEVRGLPKQPSRRNASSREVEESAPRLDRRVPRADSPDDLMDVAFEHETSPDELFPKKSRVSSLHHPQTAIDVRQEELDGILHSSPPPRTASESRSRRPLSELSIESTHVKTPAKVSKISARLNSQSPDELHSGVTIQSSSKHQGSARPSGAPVLARNGKKLNTRKSRNVSPDIRHFPLESLLLSGMPESAGYKLIVDLTARNLAFDYQDRLLVDGEDGYFRNISFDQVMNLLCSRDDLNCRIVILRLRGGVIPEGNLCGLSFASTEAYSKFLDCIEGIGKPIYEPRERLESTMARIYATFDYRANEREFNVQRQHQESLEGESYANAQRESRESSRRRLGDRLDLPSRPDTASMGKSKPTEANGTSELSHDKAWERPHRRTRSSKNDLIHFTDDNEGVAVKPTVKKPQRRQGEQWYKPLVYPASGRNRQSVTWDDLGRLEDDEFLNDSLIALFLRYLENNSNPDEVKRMHVFNSYFYANLSRNKAQTPARNIDYNSVKSWTKNINLFNRDFVVVPVCESNHWYVMIICNLPALRRNHDGAESEEEVQEITAPEDSKIILTSDIQWTDTTPGTPSRKHRGRRIVNQKKYDVKKPIIITLDSLNIGRSPTASLLKQYVVEEAKDKLNLEIDPSDVPGMTAKGIPLQPNFSDCGLYVCMYMEQFMRDPYAFVKRILQREEGGLRWPSQIESGQLRQHYYDMLQELHTSAWESRESKISPVGEILIKMRPSYDVGELNKTRLTEHVPTREAIREGIEFYRQYRDRQASQEADEQGEPSRINDNTRDITGEPTELPSNRMRRDSTTSRHFPHPPPVVVNVPALFKLDQNDDIGSAETVQRLSPPKTNGEPAQTPTNKEHHRTRRSFSCSTDVLGGSATYNEEEEWNGLPDEPGKVDGVEIAESFNGERIGDEEMMLH